MEPVKANAPDPLTEAALKSLKDIVVPEPVTWMPQTWAWGILAAIVSLAIIGLLANRIRHYRANAYRREALALLDGIAGRLKSPTTHGKAIVELAEILKRVALAGWPRDEVASLSGAAWVNFLEEYGGKEAGHALDALLDDCEYQSCGIGAATASIPLMSATRQWIRGHHVSA